MTKNFNLLDSRHASKTVINEAVEILRNGGIVVGPTDTAYMLAVDAENEKAVKQIRDLKQRAYAKPFHIIVSDIEMAERYAFLNNSAKKLANRFLPGALTLVVPRKDLVSDMLVGNLPSVGIRIPAHEVPLQISRILNRAITATSANRSGGLTPYSISDVSKEFEGDLDKIGLLIDEGVLPGVQPSTLVDLTTDKPRILRQGPISEADILSVVE
jgi:L-threonylcarbamoyladenylate synthase